MGLESSSQGQKEFKKNTFRYYPYKYSLQIEKWRPLQKWRPRIASVTVSTCYYNLHAINSSKFAHKSLNLDILIDANKNEIRHTLHRDLQ